MIAKQLSVFLENKTGRLTEVAQFLGDAGINMSAYTLADTSDFGILRMIVSDPKEAYNVLKAAGFTVKISEVIGLSCPNEPGALAKALQILSREGLEIEYLYAFSVNESANVILKPDNVKKCIAVLQEHKLELIAASDLYRL
ncbi:acetolactate synthase [Saccharicrinis sp. FJH54]|uniref:acetolactate synthase n=1 Tax=Saccharicrinis sp. FJH54 TaxID=3344665 RepID=UPI0035D4BDFB